MRRGRWRRFGVQAFAQRAGRQRGGVQRRVHGAFGGGGHHAAGPHRDDRGGHRRQDQRGRQCYRELARHLTSHLISAVVRTLDWSDVPNLQLVQDPAADALLESNPFALLIGMMLDQQYPMEHAFAGPKKIADRIGGVDPFEIADYDPEEFATLCSKTPAIHRFPGSMAQADPNAGADRRRPVRRRGLSVVDRR